MLFELILLSAVAFYLIYRWSTVNADFFEKRGVPHDKQFPFLGSMRDVLFQKVAMFDLIVDLYNKCEGLVYGIFDQRVPVFLIRDPELIKQITIKNFDHFINHRTIFVDDLNLLGSSVFFMKNGIWRDMRSTLTPAFTGSKMRQMFQLINKVAQDSIEYLKEDLLGNTKEGIDVDFKDFGTRFTNDIVASTAFGLEVNSFKNRENEFYRMGKVITNFTTWQNIKFLIISNFKPLSKFLKLEVFDRKYTEYFMHLVLDAMKYRKEHNIFRPDMINILMEARGMIKSENPKTHNREWTDIDIVAQCFGFFFAGFETASVLMCFATHELMENPDIQEKLLEEIREVNKQLDDEPLTYEALQNMKYMDMVISETLRKWPPTELIDRQCNKDFVFEMDGERVEIKNGENIFLPVAGLHRDPKYFENPMKFDPERFSDENKDKIVPCTYLPFGLGPRNCIGFRFVLLEAKSLIFYLLRDFKIEISEKSTIPVVLNTSSFQLGPKGGFWIKLVHRK